MKERGFSTAFCIKNVRMRKNSLKCVSPFQHDLDKRLSPIKHRLGVYSCRKETPSQIDQKDVLLSTTQIDMINRQFELIKRVRHQPVPMRESFYVHDALYKSLYIQRQKGLEWQHARSYDRRLPNLSRLSNPEQHEL